MSLEINENKEKVIKDLEYMAKKLKKRISLLDKSTDDPFSVKQSNESIAVLVREYVVIKKTIIEIIKM